MKMVNSIFHILTFLVTVRVYNNAKTTDAKVWDHAFHRIMNMT